MFLNMRNLLFCLVFISLVWQAGQVHASADSTARWASASISVDLVSRYVWRAIPNNTSPSVQPTLNFALGKFNIGTWASYTVSCENLQEIDIYAGYESSSFSVYIYDYYNPIDALPWKGDYFNFDQKTTRHTIEGIVTYRGAPSVPLKLLAGIMLYGDDRSIDTVKNTISNNYSTYIEAGYTFKMGDIFLYPYIGFTPFSGYYASGPALVNVGLTARNDLVLGHSFTLPIQVSLILNPHQNRAFVVVGISI